MSDGAVICTVPQIIRDSWHRGYTNRRDTTWLMSYFNDLKLGKLEIDRIDPATTRLTNLTELSLTGNRYSYILLPLPLILFIHHYCMIALVYR
jgi:hypothetical protein